MSQLQACADLCLPYIVAASDDKDVHLQPQEKIIAIKQLALGHYRPKWAQKIRSFFTVRRV
jgi:hypothetical protein